MFVYANTTNVILKIYSNFGAKRRLTTARDIARERQYLLYVKL
jgi:hypothetical protein